MPAPRVDVPAVRRVGLAAYLLPLLALAAALAMASATAGVMQAHRARRLREGGGRKAGAQAKAGKGEAKGGKPRAYGKGFSFANAPPPPTLVDPSGCRCEYEAFGADCKQLVTHATSYLPYAIQDVDPDEVKNQLPHRLFDVRAFTPCESDIDEALASGLDDDPSKIDVSTDPLLFGQKTGEDDAALGAANVHAHGGSAKLASPRAAYAVRLQRLYEAVRTPDVCLHGHTYKAYQLYRIPAALDLPSSIAAAALAAQDAIKNGKAAQFTTTSAAGGVTHAHEALLGLNGHEIEAARAKSVEDGHTISEAFASEYCGNVTGFACHFEPLSTCALPGHRHAGDDKAADEADDHRLKEFKAGKKMSVLPGEGGGLSSRDVPAKPVMQGASEHDPSHEIHEVPRSGSPPENLAKFGSFWWTTNAMRYAARMRPESKAIMERVAEGLGLNTRRAAVGMYLPHCPGRTGTTLRKMVQGEYATRSKRKPVSASFQTRFEKEQTLYVGHNRKYRGYGPLNADPASMSQWWWKVPDRWCADNLEKLLPAAVELARSLGRGEHKGEAVIYIDTPNADAIAGLNVFEGVRVVHLKHADAKMLARYKASSRLTSLAAGEKNGRKRFDMRTNDPPSEWGLSSGWKGGHDFGGDGEWGSPSEDWRSALRLARTDASIEELALLYVLAHKVDAFMGPMTAPRFRVAYQLAVADRGYFPPFASTDGSALGRLHVPDYATALPGKLAPPPPPKEVARVIDLGVRWDGNEVPLKPGRDMDGKRAKLHKDRSRHDLAYNGQWRPEDVPMISSSKYRPNPRYRTGYRRGVGAGFGAHRSSRHFGCMGAACAYLP